MKYQTGVAMEAGAANPGGAAGAGIGMGAGLAMGQQMANSMQGSAAAGSASAGAVPPPLKAAAEYHVAVDGQATGPFPKAALQQQQANGSLQKDTLVWTVGMEDWAEAGQVSALADLFASKAPPPLPAS